MKLHAVLSSVLMLGTAASASAQMSPPPAITAQAFAAAATGSIVEIAVRVQKRVRSELVAELLDEETSERYRATGRTVRIFAPAQTPIVMGTRAEVDAPGAIVFVKAVVTGKGHADAKRFVVITPYATVH
ncbi:MAG TPA: hypothetical protein VGN14_13185 [Candidatus Elarobacter sp.]